MNVLNTHVLLLNKNYSPVWITTAKDAFIKLFNGAAEAVTVEDGAYVTYDFDSWAEISELKRIFEEADHEDWVYTEKLSLIVPRIIRSLNYDKPAVHDVKLTRRNIFLRDQSSCQYCGTRHSYKNLQIDHVVPVSRGGKNTWTNLVCACFDCNSRKANRTPFEAGMKLIRTPFKPVYNPLFNLHMRSEKYISWRAFISEAYWNSSIAD